MSSYQKFLLILFFGFTIGLLIIFFPSAIQAQVQTVIFRGEDPCQYWKSMFDFAMVAAGILTAAVVMIGGLYYIVSFGQTEKLQRAKDVITGAITGLILTLTSWGLFNVLAPTLLKCELRLKKITLPTAPTAPTTPTAPTGLSDPCAGVPPEKLFATEEECKTKGGAEGGACKGRCMQAQAAVSEVKSCTTDADCAKDQKCIEGTCQPQKPPATTFNRFNFSLFSSINAAPIEDPETSLPAEQEQQQRQQTQQQEAARPRKWCCIGGGSCPDVVKYIDEGKIKVRPYAEKDLREGGERTRCQQCSSDDCQGTDGKSVNIDPRICSLLISLVDNGGFTPTVTCLVRGHGRCRRCADSPTPENPCRFESAHWYGRGMDLATDNAIQKWIAENYPGIQSLYGPAGFPSDLVRGSQSQCPPPEDHGKHYRSPYVINNGRKGAPIDGGTLCHHKQHIHVDF